MLYICLYKKEMLYVNICMYIYIYIYIMENTILIENTQIEKFAKTRKLSCLK